MMNLCKLSTQGDKMSDFYFTRMVVKRNHYVDQIFAGVIELAQEGQHPRDVLNYLIDKQSKASDVDKSFIDVTAFNKL